MHARSRAFLFLALTIITTAVFFSISLPSTRLETRQASPTTLKERDFNALYEDPKHQTSYQRRAPETCEISGNQDLYGIGIRIGFYLQVCAASIAVASRPDDAKSFFATNAWFQIGLFVALIYNSANATIYAAEGFIAMNLIYLLVWYNGVMVVSFFSNAVRESGGGSSSGNGDDEDSDDDDGEDVQACTREHVVKVETGVKKRLKKRRQKYTKDYGDELKSFPRLSLYVIPIVGNMVLFAATQYYSTWFWWKGLYVLKPGPCEARAFFFANIKLRGWLRWLHRVFNSIMIFGWTFGTLMIFLGVLGFWCERWWLSDPRRSYGTRLETRYPGLEKRRRHYAEYRAGLRKWHEISGEELPEPSEQGDEPDSEGIVQDLPGGEGPNSISLDQLPSNSPSLGGGTSQQDANPARAVGQQPKTTQTSGAQAASLPRTNSPDLPEANVDEIELLPARTQSFTASAAADSESALGQTGIVRRASTESSESTNSEADSMARITMVSGWVFSATMMIFGVLTIELTIIWNHITDVNNLISTGQLIPFVIGAGTMCQSCYGIVKRRIVKRKKMKRKQVAGERASNASQ